MPERARDDDRLDDLPDVIERRRLDTTVFRVTGQRSDGGGPDHGGAAVYILDVPAELHLHQRVVHHSVDTFAGHLRTVDEVDDVAGGIVLPSTERVPVGLGRLCRRLRRQRHVTVEAWAPLQPGYWWYAIVPSWHDDDEVDSHRLALTDGQELWAGGRVERPRTWRWGRPLPVPRSADGTAAAVGRFSWYLVAVTDVPPPHWRG